MDTKKLLIGTLAGAVVSLIAGFLVYGFALKTYMAENTLAGLAKDPIDILGTVLSHVFLGLTLSYIFLKWANVRSLVGGLKAGATLGLLVGLVTMFVFYGTTNMYSGLSAGLVDVIAWTIIWGAGGLAAGWGVSK